MRNLPSPLFLILLMAFSGLVSGAHADTIASIPTEGQSWDHSTITVQISPASTSNWFKTSFTSDVSNGIERWAGSLAVFTDAYGFRYLRDLHFSIFITGINQTASPDVQMSFINFDSSFVGVTRFSRTASGYFQKPISMQLATFDSSNTIQLTDNDMTNIAMHEFGHALGLDHASTVLTDDRFFELMYKSYQLPIGKPGNSLEEPSTLDIYALSQVYSWLGSSPTPTGVPITTFILPTGIAYSAAIPYPDQIASYKALVDQLNQRVLVLSILIIILFDSTITLAILLARKRPPPTPTPQYPGPPGPEPAPDPSGGSQ
jgi:hypothetical protein